MVALPQQLTIYDNSEEAVEERLETLVACGDYLVKHLQRRKRKQPLDIRRVDKRDGAETGAVALSPQSAGRRGSP